VSEMKCQNCGVEITGYVYYEPGLTYRACSMGCFAQLRTNVCCMPVEKMVKHDME